MQEAQTLGRRDRKKRETRRALAGAARDLVDAHGLDAVTVEDIASAADVSVRTFFNYFSCKEEAIVGIDDAVLEELADELLRRPAEESPVEALLAALYRDLTTDPDTTLRLWRLRGELARRHPALLPRHLESFSRMEDALTTALAQRLGVDPQSDPTPRVTTAAVLAITRSTMSWWFQDSDQTTDLPTVLRAQWARLLPNTRTP